MLTAAGPATFKNKSEILISKSETNFNVSNHKFQTRLDFGKLGFRYCLGFSASVFGFAEQSEGLCLI